MCYAKTVETLVKTSQRRNLQNHCGSSFGQGSLLPSAKGFAKYEFAFCRDTTSKQVKAVQHNSDHHPVRGDRKAQPTEPSSYCSITQRPALPSMGQRQHRLSRNEQASHQYLRHVADETKQNKAAPFLSSALKAVISFCHQGAPR